MALGYRKLIEEHLVEEKQNKCCTKSMRTWTSIWTILALFSLSTLLLTHLVYVVETDSSPMEDEANLKVVAKATNDFALLFYNQIAKSKPNQNLISSPLSVQTVLGMLMQGSNGVTKSELMNGLKFEPYSDESIQKGFLQLINRLKGSENLTIDIANRIYVDQTFELKEDFKHAISTYFKSTTGVVNFYQSPEPSRVEINKWVEDKTNNRIKDLLPKDSITPLTRSVLVNAIYFKGKWKYPFDKERTTKGIFNINSIDTTQVDYMKITKHFNYGEINSLDAKVLELPYSDEDYSMLVILPNKVDGLNDLENKLATTTIAEIKSQLDSLEVNVQMPKFKIESSFSLKENLEKMGMGSMFDEGNANFSGISNEHLVVSKIVQKAFVEVTEEGTEAAAATGVIIGMRSDSVKPPLRYYFYATHPFIYALNGPNAPLFVGRFYPK